MITLVFGSEMSAARRSVFENAAAKWDWVIDTGFDPVAFEGETLRGLQIDASIITIDGAEGILGQAGPRALRSDTGLPITGIMQFDDADIARLEADGSFSDVILHEMAHVIGFGTLWPRLNLVAGAGTDDPRFVGAAASREFLALDPDGGAGVPIANTGGGGTRDAHWREAIFGDELLTGFLSGAERPLSRMSIASFADLGYEVDFSTADPFELPDANALALLAVNDPAKCRHSCPVARPVPTIVEV